VLYSFDDTATERVYQSSSALDALPYRLFSIGTTLASGNNLLIIVCGEYQVALDWQEAFSRMRAVEPQNAVSGDSTARPEHTVQFYTHDTFLLDELSQFIGTALARGSSAVVIATKAHAETLLRKLKSLSIDVSRAATEGRYLSFDAGELLSQFMEGGIVDSLRFFDLVGGVLSRASAASREQNRQVVAFGEMVALLWADGKAEAAIQLEKLWNGLARTQSFSLRCAYPIQGFSRQQDADSFLKICNEHSAVIPQDTRLSDHEAVRDSFRSQTTPTLRSDAEWRGEEQRFKLFVESVQDYAIFMLDPQGNITSWNAGAERIKGYSSFEIFGKHFSCFYPPEALANDKPTKFLEIAARDGHAEDEGWRVRKDGSQFWARVTLTAVRDRAGSLVGFGKVTRDLTDLKHAELSLLRQEQRFQLYVQGVQDYALFMLDPEGNITTWNSGAERAKGYKASEIIGKHFSCFYPEEDVRRGKPASELEVAAKEGRVEDEGWRVRKDGSKFWANVIITALRDGSGNLTGFGKVTRDVTERMLAQKSLAESQQKLKESERSLRELSLHLLRTQDEERRHIGREIHDSLGQYLSVLKMKLDQMSLTQSTVGESAACANLVEECIKEVRTISYLLYPPMLEEVGLGSAIPWYLEGFSKRSGIKTTFDMPEDFERLPRDAELVLFRVLQESLTNVQRHSGSPTADVAISRTDEAVILRVTDKGKGLPSAVLEQGNRDWLGSLGVGLRGMSERLRQLGGTLEISSSESGAQLRATVPLRPPSESNAAS
jgi:PAS domain S-box-containing protein